MMTSSRTHADWLDITCHPESETAGALSRFFGHNGGEARRRKDGGLEYSFQNGGKAVVDVKPFFSRVSASGAVLAHLRALTLLEEYLSLIADAPHRVTRLDVAYDTAEDGAAVVQSLRKRYAGEKVYLTRKGLAPTVLLGYRHHDGAETGTFYAGQRSRSRVTQRTYDKQHERWEKAGEETGPWTRYELTVKADVGATLRDVVDCDPIFWHFMAPAILPLDDAVPSWESNRAYDWAMDRNSSLTDYERLKRRIQQSAEVGELASWLAEADRIGMTREHFLRMVGQAAGSGVSMVACDSAHFA